jgi:four helix bundle protein
MSQQRGKMAFRFETLTIWHDARAYAKHVYKLAAKFPRHEDYGLRSQLNRAANSISMNIAEGSAKSKNHFAVYLETAVGSTFEVVGGSFLAPDQKYIPPEEQTALYQEGERLGKSINAFRNTLRSE